MELRKDMECGEVYSVILTLDNGKILKQTGMEFINGKMEIGLKDLGLIV